ncbi:hypothetical protein [Sphingomonas sp.]|uniref:hypothetical protein n=1 Tax=Sphingomonas sp. TaxID=28214 RepID=UPI003B3BC57E
MTTPNRVRASADALAACGGSLSERIDRLDVRGTPEGDLRDELAAVAAAWCDEGFGAFEAIDALGETVLIPALAARDGELRLSFIKAPTASTFYFLTVRGLAVLLGDRDKAALARRVLVAEDFAPFRTVQCSFEPWTEMVADAPAGDEPALPVPRRIVRDQLAVVPLSIGPLLLTVPPQPAKSIEMPAADDYAAAGAPVATAAVGAVPPQDKVENTLSPVFETWRDAALPQLLLSLSDEVWRQDGETRVMLTGPRKRKLIAALDKVDARRDFKLVTAAADWVFNSGRDAETRHTLFVYELAREWPGEEPFGSTFADRAPGALEAAKTAFRMHVRDASKETLKSLQELRKTLADDVTRVVNQTRELTSTLWRDLLVVVAAVLGRFTLLAIPEKGEAEFADALLYGLAIYLAFSLGMVLFANARFMALFRKVQAKWQIKLYGFVDPEDFKTLATEPLSEAETVYTRTRDAAITAYGLAIIALIALAVLTPAFSAQSDPGKDNSASVADTSDTATNASDPDNTATPGSVAPAGNGAASAAGAGGMTAPSGKRVPGAPAANGGAGLSSSAPDKPATQGK